MAIFNSKKNEYASEQFKYLVKLRNGTYLTAVSLEELSSDRKHSVMCFTDMAVASELAAILDGIVCEINLEDFVGVITIKDGLKYLTGSFMLEDVKSD